MRALPLRQRQLIAVALLLLALGLAYLLVVLPITTGFANRAAQREQLLLTYQHNLRREASIPRLRRQAERQRVAARPFMLEARSPELAREMLRERLETALLGMGADVRETNDAEAPAGWVGARVTARMGAATLAAALERLQLQPPYLIVRAVTVGADEALVTGQPAALDVQIDVAVPVRAPAAR